MSVVKNFILTVVKKESEVSVISAISRVSGSEVKLCRERSQRFHFNSSESKTV